MKNLPNPEIGRQITMNGSTGLRWAILLFFSLLVLSGCARLPEKYPPRSESYALPPTSEGKLAEFAKTMEAKHGEGMSAFLPIDHNDDALRWRLLMVDLAENSIDAQYFIFEDDDSANLFAKRLLKAADRGVRVRVLVDDLKLIGGEEGIAAANQHPNIEFRVYNPWQVRDRLGLMVGIEFLTRMKELNRRMHNKILAVDNHMAIIGGRNIGDAYFGFSPKYNFRDLELLAVGPVAQGLSESFDLYWNSDLAYPGDAMVQQEIDPGLLDKLRAEVTQELVNSSVVRAGFTLEPDDWSKELRFLEQNMTSGPSWVVYDDPPSTTGEAEVRLVDSLDELAEDVQNEILIASAYFVPDEEFIEYLREVTRQGIRVAILTNSLASVDESGVSNSVYKKWRKPIIEAGGELYEFRHDGKDKILLESPQVEAEWVAYHAKYIIIDRKRVYVGSLNFTPRSFYLNTENGVVTEDPVLAEQLVEIFERDTSPDNAWRVLLDSERRLMWQSSAGVVYRQPARGFWQRFADGFFTILPLDNQI